MKNILKSTLMALAGLLVFTACEEDRDSNPVLNTKGNVEFKLNTPEFAGLNVALGSTDFLTMTWSQPVLTTDNAPLGAAGTYGMRYAVQVSKDGNFTKTFESALAEVTDAEGNFTGTPTGHDYTTLDAYFDECRAEMNADDLNSALNKLYVWPAGTAMTATDAYLRVVALWMKGDGSQQMLAKSNVVKVILIPSKWIDVMEKPAEESYLWVPGNGNGWNHGVCPVLVSEDGENYSGYAYMNGEFKFTPVGDWSAEFNNGSFKDVSGNIDLGDGGGGNINFVGEPGMYYFTVNIVDKTINAVATTWSIIGGFNNWGDDVDMTYDTDNHCLTADVNFDTDTEWKFRRDHDWAVNFGGTFDALEQDGGNFTATAGAHTIQLFIERPAQDGMRAVLK
ncbi:MAG: hypothetical protein II949_06295 [Prevotella sp.]|nr:hypothetical protein [Prevotella sp.]